MTQKILTLIGILFLPAIAAMASDAEYIVRPDNAGECYLDNYLSDDEYKSPAQFCKQCLKDAGDAIFRTFHVVCQDSDSPEFAKTKKSLTVSLDCDDAEQTPKNEAWWLEQATLEMKERLPALTSEQCDLGDWPIVSKQDAGIAGGVATALLALGIWAFVEADEDDESQVNYEIKKKEGNNAAECRNKNKRLSHKKHCHNCKSDGGDRVVWKYDVYCNGKRMANQIIESELLCKRSIPSETEQKKQLLAKAEKELEKRSTSWHGCETTQ